MRHLVFIATTFALAFAGQIAWWRYRAPRRQIYSILWFFPLVFLLSAVLGLASGVWEVDLPTTARLVLLYMALVLSYAIIFSAVEVSSPTLSIVGYIADKGSAGCPQDELASHVLSDGSMRSRLELMEVGGLITIQGNSCHLTANGLRYARLFDAAARFFGLPRGG